MRNNSKVRGGKGVRRPFGMVTALTALDTCGWGAHRGSISNLAPCPFEGRMSGAPGRLETLSLEANSPTDWAPGIRRPVGGGEVFFSFLDPICPSLWSVVRFALAVLSCSCLLQLGPCSRWPILVVAWCVYRTIWLFRSSGERRLVGKRGESGKERVPLGAVRRGEERRWRGYWTLITWPSRLLSR